MIITNLAVLILDAVRLFLLMRYCRICIGPYFNRKFVGISFAILWVLNCFLRISAVNRISANDPFLFIIEIVFLLIVSFLFQGKVICRIIVSFLLPILYWIGAWAIMHTLFHIHTVIVTDIQYLIGTSIAVILFAMLEFVLEKTKKSKQEQKQELLEQEIRIYENQFDIIQQSQQNVHALRHDMKHHMKMLADLISHDEMEVALKYLSDMGAFLENDQEYVSSGNERIDSILNYMIGKAKIANINTDWKISIPEHLDVSTFDINVILSNLLDNALNALSKVPQPELHILIKYDRGILCISIENNCDERRMADKKEYSIFESADGHGYGLKNVQRIVEKYHGNFMINCKDGFFVASILLFL